MQRYFVEDEIKNTVKIIGDDFHHIKNVMRMKPGHKVSVCDGDGKCYICELDSIKEQVCLFNVLEQIDSNNEVEVDIYLAAGLLKGDKFDYVVQKATELGVKKIIPLDLNRNIVKLDAKKLEKRKKRWEKIAKEAAEQSKRNMIPKVENLLSIKELSSIEANCKYVAYEETSNSQNLISGLQKLTKSDIIILVIGPEGGLDKKEVDFLLDKGYQEVSLGKRILRAETASIHAVGVISAYIEHLGC